MSNLNQKVTKYRWIICALLFFATTVNYLDRQVLSLLKPTLEEIFGWTNTDYANIGAAFAFVYALSMVLAGPIIDRLGTKKGYAWAIVVWSFGAIIHALVSQKFGFAEPVYVLGFHISVLGFIVARAVLAFGEAGNFPAAIKTTAEWFPKKERAIATGVFNSGANVGAILAPLTVPAIAVLWGWEMAFILVGAVGFVWLIFWLLYYDTPLAYFKSGRISKAEFDLINSDDDATPNAAEEKPAKVSWKKLLSYRQTWAFAFGKFMTDGVWWFLLFWLPDFMKVQYGMAPTEIAIPLAVLYSMTCIGSIGGGFFPKYFINKGYEPYSARMRAMFVIALFPLTVLLAQWVGDFHYWFAIIAIGIAASAHQAWSANIFTTVSDMFPKKVVASIVGIGGLAGGMGGVVLQKLAGFLGDHATLGQYTYTIMFVICAVAYLIAWSVMKTLVPKFTPIRDL